MTYNSSYVWSTGATTSYITDLCPGSYSVTVTDHNITQVENFIIECPPPDACPTSASVCVDILPNSKAQISATPAPVNGILDICQGQTVYFKNTSTAASSYVWDFGDNTTSTQHEPEHQFNLPGTYDVALIARNDCYCSDTTLLTVKVQPAIVPDVQCRGTVCKGETVTYSTSTNCGNLIWGVSPNGTILDGGQAGDKFVTVKWNNGSEGQITLEAEGCPGANCSAPNIIPVSIMSDDIEILGPDKVCDKTTVEYRVPNFQGTDLIWEVQGHGALLEGQGTNRITVRWDAAIASQLTSNKVICQFENCFLGCDGSDEVVVNIRPEFYVEGDVQFCYGSPATYKSRNSLTNALMPSKWKVLNANGNTVFTQPGTSNTFNYTWNLTPGSYIVRAEPASSSSFCNGHYDVIVGVVGGPPPVGGIEGAAQICPGNTYLYTSSGSGQTELSWTVQNGSATEQFDGSSVSVAWGNSTPRWVSVTQVSTTGQRCVSDTTLLVVQPLPSFGVTGPAQVCQEGTGQYSTTDFEYEAYEWAITPADAGTITAGQGTHAITVLWHKVGLGTVSVLLCGSTKTIEVNVLAPPQPQVPEAFVCQGQTKPISTTIPYSSYVWKNYQGSPISTAATPNLGSGNYAVTVTDAAGCTGVETFEIKAHSNPIVTLTTPLHLGLCPGGPGADLYATTESNGLTYNWSFNGSPIAASGTSFHTNDAGTYRVTVTDQNGCTDADAIILRDCEAIGGTCVNGICQAPILQQPSDCPSDADVNFLIAPTNDCKTHQYTNTTPNFLAGSQFWAFSDGGTSTLLNPTHSYGKPGFYVVELRVKIQNPTTPTAECNYKVFKQDTILAVAKFDATVNCAGSIVEFTDRTEYLPFVSLSGWQWDFGDPGSGASNTSNLQHPTHIFSNPGNYSVKLTVDVAGVCQTVFTRTVNVHALPTVSFVAPPTGCESTSLSFAANASANTAKLAWDFGDPASGAANSATQASTLHDFDETGTYTVSVTATSIQGCTASFSQPITIAENTMGGDISFSTPPPICPGDNLVLSAPTGPTVASWLWSNGSNTQEIVVANTSANTVTLTDVNGCKYTPPPATVTFFGQPNATIQAVEYNAYGQPVNYFDDHLSACEGEAVNLVINGSYEYTYLWEDGSGDDQLTFSEDKDNLLSQGTHVFTVTVTNTTTGCTSLEAFQVDVHPKPTVAIASNPPASLLCENTSSILEVLSPQPDITYTWITGESGTSINVFAGGVYIAGAVNQYGCVGRSNEIEIRSSAAAAKFPTGCFTRCNPDSICLPPMPEVVHFQWFLNGSPLQGPNGNLQNPLLTESGAYHVEMTDVYGCTATSPPINLELYPAFGSFDGRVWFDANENGVIDAGDTPLSGFDIYLMNGTTVVDTVTSNQLGVYNFVDVPAANYTLQLDTTSLPANWRAILSSATLGLVGCDDHENFDYLIHRICLPLASSLQLEACEGQSASYNGQPIMAGQTQTFTLADPFGCDSLVTVAVAKLPHIVSQMNVAVCENEFYEHQGQQLAPGQTAVFTETNQHGCPDTLHISVAPLPILSSAKTLNVCAGQPAVYDGTVVPIGAPQQFTHTSSLGCDSVVTVTALELPHSVDFVNGQVCENSFFDYQGQQLAPGQTAVFTQTNQHGCPDSVVVAVAPLPLSASALTLEKCVGEMAIYNGEALPIGMTKDFHFPNFHGCDSTVTVTVAALPHSFDVVQAQACIGSFYTYNGQQIAAGSQAIFTQTNQHGCPDSTLVAVAEVPVLTSEKHLGACMGGSANHEGTDIPAGETQVFQYTSIQGCDSLVTVMVEVLPHEVWYFDGAACANEFYTFLGHQVLAGDTAIFVDINPHGCPDTSFLAVAILPSSVGAAQLSGCPGDTITYLGLSIPAGESGTITLDNWRGCDSLLTVTVHLLEPTTGSLVLHACNGDQVDYEGQLLGIGDSLQIHLINHEGCDSILTVSVEPFPAVDFELGSEPICPQAANGHVEVQDIKGGSPPYRFALNGKDFQESGYFYGLSAGGYTVVLEDVYGCFYEENIDIVEVPPIRMEVTDATLPCGDSVLLRPVAESLLPIRWHWLHDDSEGPSLVASEPGIYHFTVSNDCETAKGSIVVAPDDDRLASPIYLPNSFSPNGDNVNDCFRGYVADDLQVLDYKLLVFDRWGNEMFKTEEVEGCWDGWYRGRAMDPAVFVWYAIMRVVDCDGAEKEVFKEGGVTLMK